MKMKKWYKLDSVAKIFPPTSGKIDGRVFKLSCELYSDVNYKSLQKALNKTIKRFPRFLSVLKRGFFWYYFENSKIVPKVLVEDCATCRQIYNSYKDELLFNVTYYKKRINLNVYHALTDGMGGMMFFTELISNYLFLEHGVKITNIMDTSENYNKMKLDKELNTFKLENNNIKVYKIKGKTNYDGNMRIIEAIMDSAKIKDIANSYDTTVTIFLLSLLIYSIIKTSNNRKKTVRIIVPVNLRKYFEVTTINNFFATIYIDYKMSDNITLIDIIKSVKKQFNTQLNKDYFIKQLSSYLWLEKNLIIRLIPRRIKDIILKLISTLFFKQTTCLSNLGVIKLDENIKKYINLFSAVSSAKDLGLTICSYNNKLVISFASYFVKAKTEQFFIKSLTDMGSDIIINSNKGGD
ncbi:MAG: hypothetical protein Q4G04_02035 [bacterium]|nr:hypothetical protein [bacterium]